MCIFGQEFDLAKYFVDWACTDFKGQLILKENCQAVNSSRKRTNEFDFTTMIPQVRLFWFFLRN